MPDPDHDPASDRDTDGDFTIESVTHGEPWVHHPYLGSGLGVIAAIATGIILLVSGADLVACIAASVGGGIVGYIAGIVIVLVGMSFSAEKAGYGREMGLSESDQPSLGYRVVDWLYLPLPPVLGTGTTLLVLNVIG